MQRGGCCTELKIRMNAETIRWNSKRGRRKELAVHGGSILTRTECLAREKSPQMTLSWSSCIYRASTVCVSVFSKCVADPSIHSLKLEH